jgi:thiamine biosynthesis lipoprotein
MSVHTFETMGTVVSVRVPDADSSSSERASALEAAIEAGKSAFVALDKRFSLYREDSEASQIARGELTLAEASDAMRGAYADSLEWRNRTNYTFTPHRPDGVLDLSGTIKAVGIQAAGDALSGAEFSTFMINAGGDLLCSGHPTDGWRVGVADPEKKEALITVVELGGSYAAMATSGTAERGEHIWRRPDTDNSFRQVSVIAAEIMTADVLATTIVAGGQVSLDHATSNFGIAVLVVKSDGSLLANEKFQELMRS